MRAESSAISSLAKILRKIERFPVMIVAIAFL